MIPIHVVHDPEDLRDAVWDEYAVLDSQLCTVIRNRACLLPWLSKIDRSSSEGADYLVDKHDEHGERRDHANGRAPHHLFGFVHDA